MVTATPASQSPQMVCDARTADLLRSFGWDGLLSVRQYGDGASFEERMERSTAIFVAVAQEIVTLVQTPGALFCRLTPKGEQLQSSLILAESAQ